MPNTHRDLYPEQYKHPLCGRSVKVGDVVGVVKRVVQSRFGPLAILYGDSKTGYGVNDVRPLTENK